MKRKVITVKQVARWISAEITPDEDGFSNVLIDRDWKPDLSRGLGSRTVDELVTLHGRLSRAIPDDIDFLIEFEDENAFASLEFRDGPHSGFNVPFPVPLDRHVIETLRNVDWDEFRSGAIAGTQFHENLTDYADEFPVSLESTEEIRKRHAYGIEVFVRDMTKKKPVFAVLSIQEEWDESEYEVTGFEDRKNFMGSLGDMLACSYSIVAIWANGRDLTPAEVDGLRQEAIEGLGPISRAKAEGRFWSAVEAMEGGS